MNRFARSSLWLLALSVLCWTQACQSASEKTPAAAGIDLEEPFNSLLDQMMQGVKSRQPDLISAVYAKDGYIIGPDGVQANGKIPIKKYWRELLPGATDWKLTVTQSAPSIEQLTAGQAWKALESPPRTPQGIGFKLEGLSELVFQLGRSELTFERDGQSQQSIVDFLLVWKKEEDGQYRIFLDIYD